MATLKTRTAMITDPKKRDSRSSSIFPGDDALLTDALDGAA